MVSISCCGCELFLVGVVFDVALRVGVIFLLNRASPVQLSPSSLLCSSCLESCLGFSCSCSCSASGNGQPLLCGGKSALRGRLWTLIA